MNNWINRANERVRESNDEMNEDACLDCFRSLECGVSGLSALISRCH